jgi:hypothetical protein
MAARSRGRGRHHPSSFPGDDRDLQITVALYGPFRYPNNLDRWEAVLKIVLVGFAVAGRIARCEVGAVSLKQSFDLRGIKERRVFAGISVKHG